jgi:hypothetical protein
MTSQIHLSYSLKNIFKTPILMYIFLICFLIAVTLASYSRFYIMPVFSNLLLKILKRKQSELQNIFPLFFWQENHIKIWILNPI